MKFYLILEKFYLEKCKRKDDRQCQSDKFPKFPQLYKTEKKLAKISGKFHYKDISFEADTVPRLYSTDCSSSRR